MATLWLFSIPLVFLWAALARGGEPQERQLKEMGATAWDPVIVEELNPNARVEPREDNTVCGYVEGDISDPITCEIPNTCTFSGTLGGCNSGVTTIATQCWDYDSDCKPSCVPLGIYCGLENPFCGYYLFPSSTTILGCGPARFTSDAFFTPNGGAASTVRESPSPVPTPSTPNSAPTTTTPPTSVSSTPIASPTPNASGWDSQTKTAAIVSIASVCVAAIGIIVSVWLAKSKKGQETAGAVGKWVRGGQQTNRPEEYVLEEDRSRLLPLRTEYGVVR